MYRELPFGPGVVHSLNRQVGMYDGEGKGCREIESVRPKGFSALYRK